MKYECIECRPENCMTEMLDHVGAPKYCLYYAEKIARWLPVIEPAPKPLPCVSKSAETATQESLSCKSETLPKLTTEVFDLKEQAPPSAAQLAALEKVGIFADEIKCAGHASKLLETIQKRRMENLTTPKQIRFLERVGFVDVGMWQFDSAKKMIDRIAANCWQVPRGIEPKNYKPNEVIL